jgi:putative aldouronate transport system substrate-binding protein
MNRVLKLTVAGVALLCAATLAFAAGTAEETAEPTGALEEIGFNATGMPIVDEQVTVSVAAIDFWNTPDFNDKQMAQEWEELTNVHIEWQHLPGGNDQQQMVNIMFASGDLPDAFFAASAATGRAFEYGGQGLVLPLEDLVATYAPNIQDVFAEVPAAQRAGTAPDGHLYRIQHVNQIGRSDITGHQLINTDWLDAVGMDVPTTTDELYEVLSAFKTEDPNGNGEADEIPLTGLWGGYGTDNLGYLFGAFDAASADGMLYVDDATKEVRAGVLQPGYVDAMEYFHRLYDEGLIDVEVLVHDNTAIRAKTNSSPFRVGSFMTWRGWNHVGDLETAQTHYTPVLPLEGPNGDRGWRKQTSGIGWAASMITSEAAYPEVIIRWIDHNFIPENGIQWLFGPFGVNLEEAPDGRWQKAPTPEDMGYGAFRISETFVFAPGAITASWAEENWVIDDRTAAKNDIVERYLPYADSWAIEAVSTLTPAEQEEITTYLSDIETFAQNKEAEWLTEGGVREEYEEFVDQLERMNINRIVELYQAGVDRYFGE